MSISLQGTSREGRLRIAKWVLVLLLVAAAFLHHAQPAQAQTIVYIQGEWSGSTTQSSPPPPLGPTWQISGMLYRQLVDAAWSGFAASGHGHDTILIP